MRREFQLTKEQYGALLEVGKPVPALALQCGTPPSPQASANAWWKNLGAELGFDHMTARPSDKGPLFFTAEVAEVQCDACGRTVSADEVKSGMPSAGVEGIFCHECRHGKDCDCNAE